MELLIVFHRTAKFVAAYHMLFMHSIYIVFAAINRFVGHIHCGRRDMFFICHEISQDHDLRTIWLYGKEPLKLVTILLSLVTIGTVCCSGDMIGLVSNLARSHNQRVMWLHELVPLKLNRHPAKFGGHRYCVSWDMILICHVIWQYQVTKNSWNIKGRRTWRFVTILTKFGT